MPRKTVPVLQILENANRQLARKDKWATKEFKVGIVCMLEDVLHATDNYAGFMFLDNDDSDTGTLGYYSRSYFYSPKIASEAGGRLAAAKRRLELISGTNEALSRLTIRAT